MRSVAGAEARGRRSQLRGRVRSVGPLDNILNVHGLWPHILAGHLILFRSALQRDEVDAFRSPLDLVLRYAAVQTRMPSALAAAHIAPLRGNGLDDGQILELNQVSACFNNAYQSVLGLGIRLESGLGIRLESGPGPAPGG